MAQTLQAETITLTQLIEQYGLQLNQAESFFPEWCNELPELTPLEQQQLDEIREGFFNLRDYPPLLENTVNAAIVSPLLFVGKFFLKPYHVRLEKSVELQLPGTEAEPSDSSTARIKGRIDFLLLRQNLWVTVIESKQVAYSVEAGLDQLLTYMLAAPESQPVIYGLVTSGGSFMFVKLVRSQQDSPQYGTSDLFDIRNRGNDLYSVLKILKRLAAGL